MLIIYRLLKYKDMKYKGLKKSCFQYFWHNKNQLNLINRCSCNVILSKLISFDKIIDKIIPKYAFYANDERKYYLFQYPATAEF